MRNLVKKTPKPIFFTSTQKVKNQKKNEISTNYEKSTNLFEPKKIIEYPTIYQPIPFTT